MLINWLILFSAIVLSAFFSGMETAFIAANRLRIELERKQGTLASKIISLFNTNPSKFLNTLLVGKTFALIVFALNFSFMLYHLIETHSYHIFLIITFQIFTASAIIIGITSASRILFINFANSSLTIFSIPLLFFYIIFYPITYILSSLSRENKPIDFNTKNVYNKIDFIGLINKTGIETDNQSTKTDDIKLLQNALDFNSVKVRDCMVPRTEIVAHEENVPLNELKNTCIESGFTKIVIYRNNIDNIIGYITSKSLFEPVKTKKLPIIDVSFVPETMPANKLLKKLIKDKKSLAVIVDEFGGVSGMLTIEDIIEEIFGEIEDEHDYSNLIEKEISESEFVFSGRLEIDYINENYQLQIPESDEYETLAGFIFYHHESIPRLNEHITIDKFKIKILKVTNTKIELVNIKIIP